MKKVILLVSILCSLCMYAQSEPAVFEGEIRMNVFRSYGRWLQDVMPNICDNGMDTSIVLIRENSVHQYNTLTREHVIWTNDRCIRYSDFTKSGYNVPNLSCVPYNKDLLQVFPLDEKTQIVGQDCQVTHVVQSTYVMSQDMMLCVAETNSLGIPTTFITNIMGAPVLGDQLVMKMVVNSKVNAITKAIVGDMSMSFSGEIKSITPRSVSDEEMQIPQGYKITYYDRLPEQPEMVQAIMRQNVATATPGSPFYNVDVDCMLLHSSLGQIQNEYRKNLCKAMKKYKKLNPLDETIKTYNIQDEWDF